MSDLGTLTGALGWYRGMRLRRLRAVPPVVVPTTFVWGDGDVAIGRTAAEACGEHVGAPYRFLPLDGVSHWVPEEAPDVVADAVLDRPA